MNRNSVISNESLIIDVHTWAACNEYYTILGTVTTLYHLHTLALYKSKLLTLVFVVSV